MTVQTPKVPKTSPISPKEKEAARTEFMAIKKPLNMVTSWELGDVVLDMLFTYTITNTQADLMITVLNKLVP